MEKRNAENKNKEASEPKTHGKTSSEHTLISHNPDANNDVVGDSSGQRFSSLVELTENEKKCLDLEATEHRGSSKYDLPVEFHPKLFELWLQNAHKLKRGRDMTSFFQTYLTSEKTPIIYPCKSKKPDRKSRFSNLKGDVLLSVLSKRPRYTALRQMALQLLRSNMLLKLNIMGDNEMCPSIKEIPNRLFSWSAQDYQKRRQLDNTVWLEVFELDYKDHLEKMKFKFDLQELCTYLDLILCGAMNEQNVASFEMKVMKPLEDASDLLNVYKRLMEELEENRRTINELRVQYETFEKTRAASEEEQRKHIMSQLASVDILHPIQYRYHKAWYESQVDQVALSQEKEIEKLEQSIENWNAKIAEETNAMENSMNMYYTELDFFKSKINEFNVKFEIEYEELDNTINYKKMSMNKLDLQRKFCEEQIEPMREKIAEYHARKLAEKEEKIRMENERIAAETVKPTKTTKGEQKPKLKQKPKTRKGKK